MQLAFGDINDDVGQSKQNGETTRVQALAVGEARQGLERFVGSTFRMFCNQKPQMGVASTFFEIGSTYRGGKSKSFIDTWSIPLTHAHIGSVETYKTMPKLVAKMQVSDTPKNVDHVPVIVFLVHQYVHNKPENFRWDHDRLNKALHDLSNDDRREFIAATEAELNNTKSEWKELWH